MRTHALIFTLLLVPILFTLQVMAMHYSTEVNNALRLEMERGTERGD